MMSNSSVTNKLSLLNCTVEQTNWIFLGIYSLVFVAGLTLNLIALVIFHHTKSRSHTTVYMMNLAVADLLLVLTLPLRIYYHCGFHGLPQKLCEAVGLVLLVNMYGSIFLLTCISFDRCMAICFPMSSCVKEARKKAPQVCVGVWVLTVGASLPIYLMKKTQLKFCFGSPPLYATQGLAIITTWTVGFGIPLATMLVCSWFLIRAIRESTLAQMDIIDSQKIQRMITTNLVIFLFCFLPYHILLVLLYMNREDMTLSLCKTFQYSLMQACLNTILDPLTYYFTTETFRNKVQMDPVLKMLPLQSHTSDNRNSRSRDPLNT